ncbi:MAG: hypothetical protein RL021_323 [Bacteroidota bacterium]
MVRSGIRQLLLLTVFAVGVTGPVSADRVNSTYQDPEHRQRLKELFDRAQAQVAAGKNRNALDLFRTYNILSDSLFGKELADTVDAYDRQFNTYAASRIKRLEEHKVTVRESGEKRQAARSRFLNLFWKSLVALAVWLVIVGYFFLKRRTNARQAEQELEHARVQLEASLSESEKGRKLKAEMQAENDHLPPLVATADAAVDSLLEAAPETLQAVRKLQTAVKREVFITEDLLAIENEDPEEKSVCSINELCDRYLELSYRGHCMDPSAPFECSVTRDLERNMLPVALHPAATGTVLMNILDNAFRAVKERGAREEKGYQPLVAVSTRILPRFVQVRIKDNGDGIPDDVREKVLQEFYSTRNPGSGAGAGLAEAKRILTTLHNGEIIIESEAGRGTDVYLKIFR